MNKYLKSFFHRGLVFSGLGPVVMGIIYLILENTVENFSLNGDEAFSAIISTYLLAFIHAGASVFNDVEHWSIAKSMFFHFSVLYAAYSLCYLINSWIPFDITVFLIFTAIFVVAYFAVWLTVLICVRAASKKFNQKLKNLHFEN